MSPKTAVQKMHIKPGMRVGFFNALHNLKDLLGNLPDGVEIAEEWKERELDLILAFIKDRSMMETYLSSLKKSINDDGALWIAYYKGSSSVDTDINRDSISAYASSLSLKGVAMVSIDDN